MELISQNETIINLIFCAIIVVIGYLSYNKRKDQLLVYIIASFALFGLSHYFTYMDMTTAYESFLLIVRSVAYVLIILALLNLYKRKK